MLFPHPAAVSNRVSTSQSARSEAFLLAAPRFWPPSQRVKISSQRTVKLISYRLRPGFFLVYGCANTSLNKFPFAFAKTSIQTNFHIQSCYPPKKEATDLFFSAYGHANASLNKFPFARAKPSIQTHFHLHSCYPQTKNVPPRLQKQNCTNCVFCPVHVQCTHSARYCARHGARPQNAVNTMGLAFLDNLQKKCKNIVFFVFSHHFCKNTWYLQRFVAVHCSVHCACTVGALYVCTVRALCKARCFCSLVFSSAERCNSASEGVGAHSTLAHHATHSY